MLNVLLDTAAQQNAKLSRACAGIRQNVVYGDVRFKQDLLLNFAAEKG